MADTLPFLMADASRLFRRAFETRIRAYGITGPQWRMLAVLVRHPGATQAAVAEMLEVEPITLSRMVDRLTEAGLVVRRPVEGDRRANALELTDKAEPLLAQMRETVEALTAETLEGFSTTETTDFTAFVARFRCNLTRLGDQPQ